MRTIAVATLALLAGLAAADCPNACSGHGDCQTNWDYCSCYFGWLGADCSQRLCEFGLSYIDTPQGDLNHDNDLNDGFGDNTATGSNRPAGTMDGTALNPMWRFEGWWERHPAALYGTNDQVFDLPFYVRAQEGHFYAECSNRGICNRDTGLCDCMTGYEGAACNRTVCVNSCSGHGTCESINEVTPEHLHYRLWDQEKTQYCKCDGGYFGMDCSQRQCMTNDDPLTITTTRDDYNNGLTEAGEVQVFDVRCPYNGLMLDPSVSITYTDDQFGDNYETARFDPTDVTTANEDAVAALLRALPNQVLADFTVDGVNVVRKVTGVSAEELEANSFYRWKVTFDERMGDVPLVSGTPYFKCQGGAEVNFFAGSADVLDNVDVTFTGDGPAEFLEFDISSITDDGAADDIFTYVIRDKNGDVLNGASPASHTTTTGSVVLTDATTFSREAGKVAFEFAAGADTGALQNRGAGNGAINIKIHVDPTITVNNELYTLGTTIATTVVTTRAGANDILVSAPADGAHTYDQKNTLVIRDDTTRRAAWYLNDEFMGQVIIPANGGAAALSASLSPAGVTPSVFPASTTLDFTGDVEMDAGNTVSATDSLSWWSVKTPITSINDGPDTLTVTFQDFQPPPLSMIIVIKVTKTSGAQDLFQWKVAGDTDYITDTGSGEGFNIPVAATASRLDRSYHYTTNVYPDDPSRQGVNMIRIAWADGADFDERICESENGHTTHGKYYIQIGSNGLNDAPECSDRGICDYSSGICKCFKGYAGIDCHEQNALSAGASFASA